ncbi:MAG TPA: CAP domain-containing protein [Polyangiaceae bacterium]
MRCSPTLACALLVACAHPGATGPSGTAAQTSQAASEGAVASPRSAGSPASPAGKLTIAQARKYMLDLINRDRASEGLGPVVMEDGAAQHAGQGHAEDMAKNGYLGHWGTDGSVPEQRFTEAGGSDMVMENASCFTDEQKRTLDGDPRIDPKQIEQTEDMFFHEKPPHDGHRKNILKPFHKRVGIGVAQPVATATEIPVPCFSQEFVDDYGSYGSVPGKMHAGDTLHVDGTVASPATFAGVGLARIDTPKPIAVDDLNQRRSYPIPQPFQMYWPPGYETPIPVKVAGNKFSIDVPLSDGGKAGLYEVSVWASVPGTKELVMVSLRTIRAK